ncbi:MAG: hypothetical protein ACXWIN_04570 [Burkholderiaceae bacterium]
MIFGTLVVVTDEQEPISAGQVVAAGRFAHGTALRLLAMARHGASPRLVSHANHLRRN